MSLDLALDKTGDLAFDRAGAVAWIDGVARVRQQVEITLRTWLGEWVLDTTFGMPYLERFLVKSPSRSTVEAVIRAHVQDVPDVHRVTRIDIRIDAAARSMSVDLDVDSAVGPVRVTRSIGIGS